MHASSPEPRPGVTTKVFLTTLLAFVAVAWMLQLFVLQDHWTTLAGIASGAVVTATLAALVARKMHSRPVDWIEIPQLFGGSSDIPIEALLERGGVRFRRRAREWSDGTRFTIARSDAPRTAELLAAFYEIDDTPTEPFTGNCEACGAAAVEAHCCPSCDLRFAWGPDPDDPIVQFIREHGPSVA